MDNSWREAKDSEERKRLVSNEDREFVSNANTAIPGERFRLLRRMSEPGLQNTVPGWKKGNQNVNVPTHSPIYKQIRGRKFSRRLSCESVLNKSVSKQLQTEPSKSCDSKKRTSISTLCIRHVNDTGEATATGIFLINKIGTEKPTSEKKPKVKAARRTSLPVISTSKLATETVEGSNQSNIEPKRTTECAQKRTSLPNIFGVQPQRMNGLSVTTGFKEVPSNISLSEQTEQAGLARRLLEPNTILQKPQQIRVNENKYGCAENIHQRKLNFSDLGCRRRPRLVRRLSEPSTVDKSNLELEHAVQPENPSDSEGTRRPRLIRRLLDTAAHVRSKYLPELPVVRDASFEGVDIHKWLENSEPAETQTWEELEISSDLQNSSEINELIDGHRSISQMRGNSQDASNDRCDIWNDVCKRQSVVDDLPEERGCGNDEIKELSVLLRKLSTVEQSGQETSIARHDERFKFRRNTVSASENIFHRSKDYKPKQCWCLRCHIMNAMYYNGDENLDNWGNYPCFRR